MCSVFSLKNKNALHIRKHIFKITRSKLLCIFSRVLGAKERRRMEHLRNVPADDVPINVVVICPVLSGPQLNVVSQ
jgi:hypothetical protein